MKAGYYMPKGAECPHCHWKPDPAMIEALTDDEVVTGDFIRCSKCGCACVLTDRNKLRLPTFAEQAAIRKAAAR
jgi:hypothetical protein